MAKGFKHGTCGASLNFSVVGNPQPENAKENTIWIDTDAKITGWIFSATEPTEPTEGMVWIFTGAYSSGEFNAMKKNAIQVCPLSAKQFVSGAWVEKNAKSYRNGALVDWRMHLFNNGITNDALTGGIYGTNDGTALTYEFSVSPTYNKCYTTKKAVDVTGFKYLKARFISANSVSGAEFRMYLDDVFCDGAHLSLTNVVAISRMNGPFNNNEFIAELNIADYSGSYYLGYGGANSNSSGDNIKLKNSIYEWWLE